MKDKTDRVEEALKGAFNSQGGDKILAKIDLDNWQKNLISRISGIEAETQASDRDLARSVWKFASITVVCAVLISGLGYNTGFDLSTSDDDLFSADDVNAVAFEDLFDI